MHEANLSSENCEAQFGWAASWSRKKSETYSKLSLSCASWEEWWLGQGNSPKPTWMMLCQSCHLHRSHAPTSPARMWGHFELVVSKLRIFCQLIWFVSFCSRHTGISSWYMLIPHGTILIILICWYHSQFKKCLGGCQYWLEQLLPWNI